MKNLRDIMHNLFVFDYYFYFLYFEMKSCRYTLAELNLASLDDPCWHNDLIMYATLREIEQRENGGVMLYSEGKQVIRLAPGQYIREVRRLFPNTLIENDKFNIEKVSTLGMAIKASHPEAVQALLDIGADPLAPHVTEHTREGEKAPYTRDKWVEIFYPNKLKYAEYIHEQGKAVESISSISSISSQLVIDIIKRKIGTNI